MTLPFTRTLGRSGIQVSPLGMGCWAIGGPFWREEVPVGWGNVDDNESLRAIRKALDLGMTFFDTSDVYGTGHSESILGQAFTGIRSQVVIATKFGNVFNPASRTITGSDASPDAVRQSCEASLRRLNTDYIDLYQFHLGGYELEKAGEVRDTLESLARAGKIRTYGWSTDDPARAAFFAEGEHCTAVQHQLNAFEDAPEMLALCERLDLASVNRGPLAMGLLTGKFQPGSKLAENDVRGEKAPEWMKYFQGGQPNPQFLKMLAAVREVLTSGGRTLAQGALAWLWARSPKTVPIPGFKTVKQVEENAGAVNFGPLTPDQLRQVSELLASIA
jgi:aryl-alcohol dehydrogenase-like predicted oxidoreductase